MKYDMAKLNYKHTIYAGYLGYITQAIVNNLAPLLFLIFQASFSLSLQKVTVLITVNFCVQLLVDLFSAKFVDYIGYRICIVSAHVLCGVGLIGMAFLPFLFGDAYGGLLVAVILYAVGGGLIEVLISPIVESCPTKNKAAAMSLLHSFYCWGTVAVVLLSTGFLAFFGKEYWRTLSVLWALLPLGNAVLFSRVPIASLTAESEGMSLKELCTQKMFWIFLVLMVTAGASEQGMSQWASAFAEQGLGVSKAIGDLAGPCFFSILMGSARTFYAKFGEKIDLLTFMLGSGALCVFAYLLAALSPIPILSLIGCGLCGLSVGILWPGVFSVASGHFPRGGTALFALLALGGDLGCSSGPTLVGMVAGAYGEDLKAGLIAAVLFPTVLILCSILCRRNRS